MEAEAARFIREVPADESLSETVNAAKALTWEYFREHAVLRLIDGRVVLVQGGRYGINLQRSIVPTHEGRSSDVLFVMVEDRLVQVRELVFHVHPKPTGPSDDDLLVMKLLNQEESRLFEISGPRDGTLIRAGRK